MEGCLRHRITWHLSSSQVNVQITKGEKCVGIVQVGLKRFLDSALESRVNGDRFHVAADP